MADRKQALFELGQTVATPGALHALREEGDLVAVRLLRRHATGDWGDLDHEDCAANYAAVRDGERILSAYELPRTHRRLWIITEADRSVTTFLLPEEY